MIPPLRRGEFVLIQADGKDDWIRAMVGLASENGASVAFLFDAMVGSWVQMMPCSEVGPAQLETTGIFEALDGLRVTVTRLTPSITCPTCGAVSYNRNDIEQRYCGACHQFHEFMQ